MIHPVFVQTEQVWQCFKCWRFGHTKNGCRSVEACRICGKQIHDKDHECLPNCVNCNLAHESNDKSCPDFLRRKDQNMKKARAMLRTDQPPSNPNPFMFIPDDFPLMDNSIKRSGRIVSSNKNTIPTTSISTPVLV